MLPRISSFIASLCLCASFVAVGPATAGSYDDALTAATLDRAAELSDLLERGIDPDTADTNGNTLLILAARGATPMSSRCCSSGREEQCAEQGWRYRPDAGCAQGA